MPADGGVPPTACELPIAEPPNGEEGWERCGNMIHRYEAAACALPEELVGTCDPDFAEAPECTSDADCDGAPNGVCDSTFSDGFGPESCGCVYPCETDSDCGDGQVCYCNGSRPYCMTAYCATDDDCEEGYACRVKNNVLACDTPLDTCRSDTDCPGEECPSCTYEPSVCGSQCAPSQFGCTTAGRPFLVEGTGRTASLTGGEAWCNATVQGLKEGELDSVARAQLAEHWAACGLMEHASVAAFARFALQLTAVGAPPDLLVATASAMQDEVEHAQVCFALARRYGGRAVGPGPINTRGVLDDASDLVSVAELAAREACVGETMAAAEAAEGARVAQDIDVRAALKKITEDELRHAALGWRFVRWAMGQVDAPGRARILAALADAASCAGQDIPSREGIPAHGLLSGSCRARVFQQAAQLVVTPVIDALRGAAPLAA